VYRIEDTFHSERRCYLALVAGAGEPVSNSRNVQLLEEWLIRGSQKAVALDLGLSSSTVAATARHCLMRMGMRCAPRRVPAILVMAAKASRGVALNGDARVSLLHEVERCYRIVSVRRLDDCLWEELTPAESYVVRGVVEGRGHADIARARGCSPRTVANQLAAAFQRLKVSGRAELMGLLIERRMHD
jgi:DNA-binding NarL/FixJ family response regulator